MGLFKTVAVQGSACKEGGLPSAIVGGTKYEEHKGMTKAVTKKIVVETGMQVPAPKGVCFHNRIKAWLFVSVPKAWRELMGEKMMEMYKTKATKAWQALERIIQLLLWRQLLLSKRTSFQRE